MAESRGDAAAALRIGTLAGWLGQLGGTIAAVSGQLSRTLDEAVIVDLPATVDVSLITSATPPAQSRGAPSTAASARPEGVFGSVAIGFRRLPAVERMRASYHEMRKARLLSCDRDCGKRRAALVNQISALRGAGFTAKVAGVNRLVNGFVNYRRDIDNHGVVDYWSTPLETLARGNGDCEDYAILKLALLGELGVPQSSMSVVVLSDERRGLYHAVLSVRTTQGFFILDNMQDRVKRDGEIGHYQPLFSVSDGRGFIHGRRATGNALVSGLSLGAVAPGEGPIRIGIRGR